MGAVWKGMGMSRRCMPACVCGCECISCGMHGHTEDKCMGALADLHTQACPRRKPVPVSTCVPQFVASVSIHACKDKIVSTRVVGLCVTHAPASDLRTWATSLH